MDSDTKYSGIRYYYSKSKKELIKSKTKFSFYSRGGTAVFKYRNGWYDCCMTPHGCDHCKPTKFKHAIRNNIQMLINESLDNYINELEE
jgi:hypothetical protein